jgi:hypothetical protein
MCFGGGSSSSSSNAIAPLGRFMIPPGGIQGTHTPGMLQSGASNLLTPTTPSMGTSNIETTRGGGGMMHPLFAALFGPQSVNQNWSGTGAGGGIDLLRNFGLNFANLLTGGRYNQQNTNQVPRGTRWER